MRADSASTHRWIQRFVHTGPSLVVAGIVMAPAMAWGQPSETPAAPASSTPAAPGAAATPNTVKDAAAHYERGLKFYDDNDFEAARIEFERAYALSPTYKVLFNIGHCYRALNNYADALKSLQRYLVEGGESVPSDRRELVETEISELKQRVAKLMVVANLEGVDVRVDDVPVGKTPLSKPLMINPGRRKVAGTKAGFFPATEVVTVSSADNVTVRLELQAPASSTPERKKEHSSYVVPIVGFGVTAALLGTGIGMGLAAQSAQDDRTAKLNTPGVTQKTLDDAHSKMRTFAVLADVFFASAVVAGAASGYLTFRVYNQRKKERAAASKTGVDSVQLGLLPTGGVLTGAF